MKGATMSRRLTKKNKARLESYWQQQEQIDCYERILDSLRAYRDDLARYGEGDIHNQPLSTVARDLTEILEWE